MLCAVQPPSRCTERKGRGWLMRWLPARAHDNGMFLVFANGVGQDDDEVRTGNAMVIDCYGRILHESPALGDDMVVADLDASLRERIEGAAGDDPQVILRFGFVPEGEVASLFGAADAAGAVVGNDISGFEGSRPRSFSATITWAELETGSNSQAPWMTARMKIWRKDTSFLTRCRA
jgi:hypothetical protein